MTTTVTINAHLMNTKEVKVLIRNKSDLTEIKSFVLQDGESSSEVVYDDREIVISEVLKEA